jgi:S1-C subfamily serine protease
VDPCTPEEVEALGVDEKSAGVRVTTVFSGGLVEKLLQPGDLVYSWNGFPLYADDPVGRFQAFVNAARTGEQIVLRYLRGKEKRAATVKF